MRSPDPAANPYVAFAALIRAGLDGVTRQLEPPAAVDLDLFHIPESIQNTLTPLPRSLEEAVRLAGESAWLRAAAPDLLAFLPEDMAHGRA